jgi:hypothetical protein
MAASLRRNISFPAPCPSHPGARKRRQRITNQPSISSPTTAAAVIPRSSTAFGSQRSSEKHPSPQPLPRQIPIDDQALIALPRVRSSEAFGRRSPYTGSNARVGPASETLNDTLASGRHPKPLTIPAVREATIGRLKSTLSGHSARRMKSTLLQRRTFQNAAYAHCLLMTRTTNRKIYIRRTLGGR